MSVLRPSPGGEEAKYNKRRNAHVTPEFRVRTPCVVRASSSLVEVAPATDEAHLTGRGSVPRGATPAADAEGDRLLGLVLVLSLARLLVDRRSSSTSTRTARRKETAAPPLLRLRCCASLRLSRLMLASLAPSLGVFQRHALYQVVFGRRRPGRSAACRLLSAVARTQRTVGRPTARASRLAPCTRRSRSGRKTACCLVLADVIFFFAHSGALGAKKPPCGPWRRRGMAALCG
jgi:hypothetical protein